MNPETQALDAAAALHDAAADFVAACEALAPLAEALAHAERRHRAALAVAGIPCHLPPTREHAAEVALHALAPLTPYVALVTRASGEHHRAKLLNTRQKGHQ